MPNMTVKDLRGWKVETHLARESLRSFHETCRANVRRFYDPDEEATWLARKIKWYTNNGFGGDNIAVFSLNTL